MHPAMDLFFVLKSALLKHCTMQLSFSQIGNLRFSPQQPFSGCLIISDRNIWWLPAAQFHFWILFEYELNTFFCSSWIYKKSIAIQAVCRQDVNKIVGTSWTLALKQNFKYLNTGKMKANIFIFQIPFSQWRGSGIIRAIHNLIACQISHLYNTPFRFFANRYPIFGKYVTGIFFLQYLNSCLPVRTGNIRFGSKFSKNWAFTCGNLKFQWIAT